MAAGHLNMTGPDWDALVGQITHQVLKTLYTGEKKDVKYLINNFYMDCMLKW